MRNFRLILLATLMIISSLTFAQEKVDRTPKISGFVQALYQADFDKDFKLEDNTGRMRRVRMSVSGKLTNKLSYKIQGDFVREIMLVDAYAKYDFCKAFSLQAGQFKIPFTMETAMNPLDLEIFDYGDIVQKLVGYDDVCGIKGIGRDIGAMATGKLFAKGPEDNQYYLLEYAVGVFNGNGVNNTDNNNRKDVAGRLVFHPWIKEVSLTGSCYIGNFKKDSDNTYGDRNRWSGGAEYKNEKLVVRGEFIGGETGVRDTISNFKSNGFYAVAGYNFEIGKEKTQILMPVIRYERFTKDVDIEKSGKNLITVGVNYWPVDCLNFKVDYTFIKPDSGDEAHRIAAIMSYKF